MYRLSMIVTLVGALALAGCSDGAKESKGEPGPPGPKGDPGAAGTTLRVVAPQSSTASCQTDEIMISAPKEPSKHQPFRTPSLPEARPPPLRLCAR